MTSIDHTARCRHRSLHAGLVGASLALASLSVLGQARDQAGARMLFNEGRTLVAQGRYDQACPKFEESARIENGIGTRFNLADCWEHIGRTASAWSLFLDVATSAKSSGQVDREKVARERAAKLEPRLSQLTIRVQANSPGLELRKNDVAVGPALFGTANPVDPGSYTIEARAPGKKNWRTAITIAPNTPDTLVLVPELENEARASSVAAPEVPALRVDSPTAPNTDSTMGGTVSLRPSGQRTVALIVGAAGLVGVGVGSVFAAMTKSADDKAAALCTGGPARNQCVDNMEKAEFDETSAAAQHRATVAYASLIGGGAALATSAILFFTSPSNETSPSSRISSVAPIVTANTLGLTLGGCW